MANSLSSKKRVRQNATRNAINRGRKSMVKTQMKHFLLALETGDATQAAEQYKVLSKKLDKVAGTSTMHKNTAARVKSRMAKRLNAMDAKQA
jgi:small subunit ribosomal protein S20